MSFAFGSQKQTTSKKGEHDPWSPTIPYLQDFLTSTGSAAAANPAGATADQTAAFGQLKQNALQGSPWLQQQTQLAGDLYGTADRTGMVGNAYKRMQGQLGDYASGKHLDPMSNPQMKAMLDQVGTDAFDRINAQFAGAGRDLSGMNQQAAARGVTQAQLPLLLDQFNRNQDMQLGASQALFGAGTQTATTQGNLDAQRAGLRSQGAEAGQVAHDLKNQGANEILDLEQQQKEMPFQDLGMLASLLFPAAKLGGQQKEKGKSSGTSLSGSFDIGKAIGAMLGV